MPVVWRDAIRQDRNPLEGFKCTPDAPRRPDRRPIPHPKPWEESVQKWARTAHPPSGANERLRLGIDSDGERLTTVGEVCLLRVVDGLAALKMTGIAIDVEHRGLGGRLADSALQDLLQSSGELAMAGGASEMIVIAWVDPRNGPSQRMLERNGFRFRSSVADDIDDWVLEAYPFGAS